jgi:hypothetical protein
MIAIACACVVLAQTSGLAQQPPAAAANAQTSATAEADRLPVKRVVLYKNGVGFFEHLGRVRGTQQVAIDFTSGQLNDVLKSLTTVDLGQGRVTGISFNTDDPASRKLGALALPLDDDTSVYAFLNAIKGARVEVQAPGGPVVGRVRHPRTRRRDRCGRTEDRGHHVPDHGSSARERSSRRHPAVPRHPRRHASA